VALSFEETLIEVWRQTLVENAKTVELGPERFPVRRTPKRGLRQVDFTLEGNEIRGLEQNPSTNSQWAQMAQCPLPTMPVVVPPRGGAGKGHFPGVILNHSRLVTIQNKTRRPALHGEFVRLRIDSSLGNMPMESCACSRYLFGT
jgi:hypothetical protein